MKEEIIIAGFGGQGVLSMGKILAYCAIMQDMEVTWMPSYGPEMRGGTANVSVILSDKKISSPIVTKFDTVIALNQQSLDKFESAVKPGGLLIYDPNGIINPPTRTDVQVCKIDAINVAAKVGNSKVYNMAVMGAYLKMKPIVSFENIDKGLAKCIPARYADLIALNKKAIEEGKKFVIAKGSYSSRANEDGWVVKRVLIPKSLGSNRKDVCVKLKVENVCDSWVEYKK